MWLRGDQITALVKDFSAFKSFRHMFLATGFSILAGPWWDGNFYTENAQ